MPNNDSYEDEGFIIPKQSLTLTPEEERLLMENAKERRKEIEEALQNNWRNQRTWIEGEYSTDVEYGEEGQPVEIEFNTGNSGEIKVTTGPGGVIVEPKTNPKQSWWKRVFGKG